MPEPLVGVDYFTSNLPGHWRQDPISLIPLALGAHWSQCKPFVLRSTDQFRVLPPPTLASAEYATAYKEVKSIGGDGVVTSTIRTPEQTFIGTFWAYDGTPSLCAPPRLYNQITVQIADQTKLSVGEFARILALVNTAMADAAMSVWELIVNADVGQNYILARQYDEALARLRKTLEMDPRFYLTHWFLGQVWQLKGQVDEAIAEYRKATELNDDPSALAMLGQAYARAGQREEAQKILARLTEQAKSRYMPVYSFALMYLALGDKERAIDEMERAYRERGGFDVSLIKVHPMLDDLRGNPRFEALAEKVVPTRLFQKP